MTRFVPVTVLVAVVAAGRLASAQTADPLNGAMIKFDMRAIYDVDSQKFVQPEAGNDVYRYFNLAHCNCAKANLDATDIKDGNPMSVGWFRYRVYLTQLSSLRPARPVDYWVGTNCNDDAVRMVGTNNCVQVKLGPTTGDIDNKLFTNGGDYHYFNLFEVVTAKASLDPSTSCTKSDALTAPIYALVSTTGQAGTYDYNTASQNAGALSTDTTTTNPIDTQPPLAATNIHASGGDGAINLSWSAPSSNGTDVAYYQALCSKMDGTPALSSPSGDPLFVTTASICPGTTADGSEAVTETQITAGDTDVPVAVTDLSALFSSLDKSFICGQSDSATATSLRLSGLTNDVQYQVILVTIDLHGNFAASYMNHTVTPLPSTDFWEDLHDRGSKVDGGLCLLAETYGDDSSLTNMLRGFRDDTLGGSSIGRWLTRAYYATAARLGIYVHGSVAFRILAAVVLAPVVMFALLWYWLTLPGVLGLIAALWLWRNRRRVATRWVRRWIAMRSVQAAVGIVIITLGAGRASAGGYQPYWEDNSVNGDENQSMADEPGLVAWHVGIRLGPYVPDVDSKFPGPGPGPYAQMFTGTHYLPMLDVDRILWSGFGQVGVGLSLGYWQKTARTFTIDSMPSDPMRARTSDVNKFWLIPMELTAIYRFTWLDDEYGVPVVPYIRGGLAYYLWWISTPNGLAIACTGGGMQPGCSQTKALGASLGVTGAIGLAIRAERIDASAATSMRQSGIQHAGLFGELSIAKVDGFGSDTKLSVGDRTWFAGVDFEF